MSSGSLSIASRVRQMLLVFASSITTIIITTTTVVMGHPLPRVLLQVRIESVAFYIRRSSRSAAVMMVPMPASAPVHQPPELARRDVASARRCVGRLQRCRCAHCPRSPRCHGAAVLHMTRGERSTALGWKLWRRCGARDRDRLRWTLRTMRLRLRLRLPRLLQSCSRCRKERLQRCDGNMDRRHGSQRSFARFNITVRTASDQTLGPRLA